MLTVADQWGRGGLALPFFSDIIFEQPQKTIKKWTKIHRDHLNAVVCVSVCLETRLEGGIWLFRGCHLNMTTVCHWILKLQFESAQRSLLESDHREPLETFQRVPFEFDHLLPFEFEHGMQSEYYHRVQLKSETNCWKFEGLSGKICTRAIPRIIRLSWGAQP